MSPVRSVEHSPCAYIEGYSLEALVYGLALIFQNLGNAPYPTEINAREVVSCVQKYRAFGEVNLGTIRIGGNGQDVLDYEIFDLRGKITGCVESHSGGALPHDVINTAELWDFYSSSYAG